MVTNHFHAVLRRAAPAAAATICTRTDAELAEAMDALPRVKDELSTTRFFSHDTGFHQMKHFITQGGWVG